jgi:uncharacterized protein (DUF1499 family)
MLATALTLSLLTTFFTSPAWAESKPQSDKGTQYKNQSQESETKTEPETQDASSSEKRSTSPSVLAPCPKRPNCVNSAFPDDKKHYIQPLKLSNLGESQSKERLLEIINSFERIKVVTVEENYIAVEFSSRWFGFVDDVELVIDEKLTHIRSASRTGYSDLGVNKKRVEEIRKRLAQQERDFSETGN